MTPSFDWMMPLKNLKSIKTSHDSKIISFMWVNDCYIDALLSHKACIYIFIKITQIFTIIVQENKA